MFDWNLRKVLSKKPFLGQIINLDSFISEHADLFLFHISTQRPLAMNDRKIEQRHVCNAVHLWSVTTSSNFSFHMKKESDKSLPKIYNASKPFWQSQRGSIFSSSAPVVAAADLESFQVLESYLWKTYVFVLAYPTSLSFARALPQELSHWFCSQILHLSSGMAFGNDCPMTA